ncbi:UvrB/UvrC motif-containing protein, partial [bacterium]|nr:UvrB/UvrC motif-containing protein [bacterium]
LESAEIKKHKPYYNTVDKKYQKYYFIKFLNNVEFPRIELTDKIEKDNAEYFGPFRSPYAVNEIIQTIDNKFKLRKCEGKLKPSAENKPCFYHHIDRCFAPCSLQITEKEYQKEVKKAEFFLTGNDEGMISHFTDEMLALSEDLKFEEAANMRNRIAELRKLFDRKQDVPASINNNNFAMVLPASDQSKTVEIFLIKSGKLVFQEQVGRKAPLTEAHRTIRSEFFSRRKPGALSLSDQDIDKLRIITAWTFRHKSTGSFVYSNGMTANDFIFEFDKAVRNTVFESEDVE